MGDYVLVNVSGHRFCISRRALRRYPHTRLATLFLRETGGAGASAAKLGDNHKQKVGHEYFFDRSPQIFAGIMDLYRSGTMHVPPGACWQLVQAELEFWQVDPARICKSCQLSLIDQVSHQKELHEMQHAFGDDARRLSDTMFASNKNSSLDQFNGQKLSVKEQLAIFFRESSSAKTKWTKAYRTVFTAVVLLYVFGYILESQQTFRLDNNSCPDYVDPDNTTQTTDSTDTNNGTTEKIISRAIRSTKGDSKDRDEREDAVRLRFKKYFTSTPNRVMMSLDIVCLALFTIDFCLRLALAPRPRLSFFTSTWTIFDIVVTLANTLAMLLVWAPIRNFSCSQPVLIVYLVLEIFRMARLFRLLQFTSRYNGIRVLLLSLSGSTGELLLLFSGLLTAVVVFGLTIYVSEISEGTSKYDNFYIGFWWALVTMTTVGYGDYAPKSGGGMIVGAMCAICGVLYVALQMPVIANRFNALYLYALEQERRTETQTVTEANEEENTTK